MTNNQNLQIQVLENLLKEFKLAYNLSGEIDSEEKLKLIQMYLEIFEEK
jgi:hypothetical protein